MEDLERTELSQSAIDALHAELENLKTEGRKKMSERLLAARELGDLSENAEYDSAKHDQTLMERRIAKLEILLKKVVVREAPTSAERVAPGVVVTIRDTEAPEFEDSYLVADSEERVTGTRVLSPNSPLGRALLGRKAGEKVTYEAPGGTFTYEILGLKPGD